MSAETRDPWGAPLETHNILDDDLAPLTIHLGAHVYEHRPWNAVGEQRGRHMVERCCPDLAEVVDR